MAISDNAKIHQSVRTGVANTPISSGGRGGPGASKVGGVAIAGIGLALSLAELHAEGKRIAKQAAQSRKIAVSNTKRDNDITELAAFRLLSTQTAQASSGGFSGKSGSTLAIKTQTQNDKDRVLINRNEVLINQLTTINSQEKAAKKAVSFGKKKAVLSFASSILG